MKIESELLEVVCGASAPIPPKHGLGRHVHYSKSIKKFCMIRTGLYRHYKGNLYHVIGISRHSESLELFVVYQALYGEYGLWIRPAAMFTEEVVVGNQRIPRFSFISDPYSHPPVVR